MSAFSERLTAALDAMPYARFLGLRGEVTDGEATLVMPFAPHLIGNPMLPALHGGVVGALMEIAAVAQLRVADPDAPQAKTIDISIDYLRSGRPLDTYARAVVKKAGRRVANVQVEAWQRERDAPIAALRGHFLLAGD